MDALQSTAFFNGLSITGKVESMIPDGELRPWLDKLAAAAARMRGSRLVARFDVPRGGWVELSGSPPTSGEGLSGPTEVGNEGLRLVRTLKDKANQVKGSEPAWLRLDESGSIWHLTTASTWAHRRAMHEGLARIVLSVIDQFSHVAGAVLSESPMMGTGGHAVDRWSLCNGRGMGLRQPLPDGSGREAIFVWGLAVGAPEEFGAWLRWYENEPTWLDWALEQHGQAGTDQIFAQPHALNGSC